jgi:hypothetical protein
LNTRLRHIAILLTLAATPALSALRTREFANLPQRPLNAALAGQSAHTMPIQAAALTNPAFLGYGDQNTFFAGGVFSSQLYGFYADGALFSPYGGLTLSAEYFKADDQTGALSFSYGSFLSRRIATGLAVTPRYTTGGGQQAFGLGVDPALLFDSKWHANVAGNDGGGALFAHGIFAHAESGNTYWRYRSSRETFGAPWAHDGPLPEFSTESGCSCFNVWYRRF